MRNVPKLRFKEFTDEWEEKKLENIGENIIGLTYSPNDIVENNGTLVLRSSNIKENRICLKDEVMVNLKINEKLLTKENDILICVRNGSQNLIGKNAIITKENENLTFGAFMTVFRSDYNKFVHQLFQTENYKAQILKNLGARINQITNKNLNSFIFNFPVLKEQEKIADFLSSIDKKIFITEEKLNLFNEYKKGIMQKIFNQKLRFKDENGNNYPEWKEKKLEELLLSGNKNKVSDTKQYQKITIKLNLKGIEKNFSDREMADTRPFYIRELNEIIIGKQNYFNGSIAIVTKEFDGCICSNAIMSFKVKKDNVKFIYSYISQKDYLKKREFLANGTGQKELSEKDFLNFTIKLPCLEEQQKIADFLSSIDTKIEKVSDELENLKELKKGLLQQMFV